jgi:hypothetical protein
MLPPWVTILLPAAVSTFTGTAYLEIAPRRQVANRLLVLLRSIAGSRLLQFVWYGGTMTGHEQELVGASRKFA